MADYLVDKGLPFREAHRVAGRLVALLAGQGRPLAEATLDELQGLSPLFGDDYWAVVQLDRVLAAKSPPEAQLPRGWPSSSRRPGPRSSAWLLGPSSGPPWLIAAPATMVAWHRPLTLSRRSKPPSGERATLAQSTLLVHRTWWPPILSAKYCGARASGAGV